MNSNNSNNSNELGWLDVEESRIVRGNEYASLSSTERDALWNKVLAYNDGVFGVCYLPSCVICNSYTEWVDSKNSKKEDNRLMDIPIFDVEHKVIWYIIDAKIEEYKIAYKDLTETEKDYFWENSLKKIKDKGGSYDSCENVECVPCHEHSAYLDRVIAKDLAKEVKLAKEVIKNHEADLFGRETEADLWNSVREKDIQNFLEEVYEKKWEGDIRAKDFCECEGEECKCKGGEGMDTILIKKPVKVMKEIIAFSPPIRWIQEKILEAGTKMGSVWFNKREDNSLRKMVYRLHVSVKDAKVEPKAKPRGDVFARAKQALKDNKPIIVKNAVPRKDVDSKNNQMTVYDVNKVTVVDGKKVRGAYRTLPLEGIVRICNNGIIYKIEKY